MTLKQAISQAAALLARHDIEDARLEAEVLLRHQLGISRVVLYQDRERTITEQESADFGRLIKRRLSGEPLAYITGHRESYGLDFRVDARVLIPRPETELLVEKALELARNQAITTIADIGTGSGAIAVSLALNLPEALIYATDISPDALEVARVNCRNHRVSERVRLLQGDLLVPLTVPVDMIIANPPYVTASEVAGKRLGNFEPELALDGGHDGLDKVRQLGRNLVGKLKPDGWLLVEIGAGQDPDAIRFFKELYPAAVVEIVPDLAGIRRVLALRFPQPGLT